MPVQLFLWEDTPVQQEPDRDQPPLLERHHEMIPQREKSWEPGQTSGQNQQATQKRGRPCKEQQQQAPCLQQVNTKHPHQPLSLQLRGRMHEPPLLRPQRTRRPNPRYIGSKEAVARASQTVVVTQNQVTCRLPEYFSEPDKFIPERWIKGHQMYKSTSPYLVLPFGHGPRTCIARRLAEQNMQALLLKIIRRFQVGWAGGAIDALSLLINKPDTTASSVGEAVVAAQHELFTSKETLELRPHIFRATYELRPRLLTYLCCC
uniref:Cytochrome P450 n=1 Tax=Timema bartmani TaxID=61472 RepID=A0A7R9EWF2_9NEOP|nr:unnamed protein product [Timema bartmani]